jgi:hypothetical protein
MFWLRLIYTRLYGLLRKDRIEQEMEDEMRFHLLMRTRQNIERGMRPEKAEREARRRFGNVGRIKDLMAKYPKPQQRVEFHNRLVERLAVLPGVNAAGFTSVLPFSSNFDGRSLAVEDQPKPPGAEISVDLYIITPDYLRTMAIPLRTGRPLTERDTE